MRGRLDRDALGAFIAALEAFGEAPRRGRMPIKIGRRIRLLELERVEFMRADGDYVTIQQRDGEALRTRDSITALETRLPLGRFLRVHRSVIVNLECVKELRSNKRGGYTLITAGDHRLATGATYAAAVQAILTR
ncbi:MAG: LytR/AlgR family response regulator transcription factor [Steroidobacteraceae bacterium]